MPKYVVTYAATGGITIAAPNEEMAKAIFDNMSSAELLNELEANGIEMTDIFEEVE